MANDIHIMLKSDDQNSNNMAAVITILDDLIMLHAPCISAQWPLNGTGVELRHLGNGFAKLGFHHNQCASATYQSFVLSAEDYTAVDDFFKAFGFPMFKPMNEPESIDAS